MSAESFAELREEVSALDVSARLQRLRDNEARRRALEADDAVVLASLERDKAYRTDGHATMFGLLRSTLRWSERECRMHTQIARLVAAVPSVGEMLFEAWVPVANITTIARLHANPQCPDQLESTIGTLLRDAQRTEHDDFKREAQRWRLRHDEGVPIRWRRERRLFTGAARDAVLALSPRCTHPGCRVRAGRCQIDHLTEWHQGGETCPDNGGIGCGRHNRMKHRRGYTVTRDRLGIWHTLRPDGTEIG